MFIKNKYYQKYKAIVLRAKTLPRKKGNGEYFESHHILPKSVYPQYRLNKRNLVLLTAKEHFVCHHLLCKCTESKVRIQMTNGFWRMLHSEQHRQRITSKVYQTLSESHATNKREQMLRDNKGFTFKGHKHTAEAKVGMLAGSINSANIQRNRSIHDVTVRLEVNGFKFLSIGEKYVEIECNTCGNVFNKHKQYLTASKFNKEMCKTCNPRKPMTAEHRAKIGAAGKGRIVSEETRQLLSDINKAKHRK